MMAACIARIINIHRYWFTLTFVTKFDDNIVRLLIASVMSNPRTDVFKMLWNWLKSRLLIPELLKLTRFCLRLAGMISTDERLRADVKLDESGRS